MNRGGESIFRRCLELNSGLQTDPFDIAEIVTDPTSLGQIVTNAEVLQQEIIAGLFELVPNPAESGNTDLLYERVAGDAPSAPPPPAANAPAGSPSFGAGAWEVTADFEDGGPGFSLSLLAIPFGGPCAGYGLLLTEPIDAANAEVAAEYFTGLIERLVASNGKTSSGT